MTKNKQKEAGDGHLKNFISFFLELDSKSSVVLNLRTER